MTLKERNRMLIWLTPKKEDHDRIRIAAARMRMTMARFALEAVLAKAADVEKVHK